MDREPQPFPKFESAPLSVEEAAQAPYSVRQPNLDDWDAALDQVMRDFPKTLARLAE